MKVKICGMREPANIQEIAALRPDLMGFIFYEKSPRYAGGLDPKVVQKLPADVIRTGVFVNETEGCILETQQRYGLDLLQLHGQEPPELCKRLRHRSRIMKVFSIARESDFKNLAAYDGTCDFYLFDTKTPEHGGSGKQFDWDLLENYQEKTPFFLSGGIGPGDVGKIKTLSHPHLAGIDINSCFEIRPGIKDKAMCSRMLEKFGK